MELFTKATNKNLLNIFDRFDVVRAHMDTMDTCQKTTRLYEAAMDLCKVMNGVIEREEIMNEKLIKNKQREL